MINGYIFRFQIVHHIIQSEKCSVQVNKMSGTAVGIHSFHITYFRIFLSQIGNFLKERLIRKVKFFLIKWSRKQFKQFVE